MTKVIARVHTVHLMNVDWASGGRQPHTKPVDLGCKSAENWQLSSTSAIAIVIITQPVGWYSFYRPTKGGRLSRPKHCSKGAQPVLKTVYRSSCRDKHNCQRRDSNLDLLTPHNCQRRDSNLDLLTPQSDALTTRLLRPAMVLWKNEASQRIGNQVWYCQSTDVKATLWSVDLTEGSNCWNMLWKS